MRTFARSDASPRKLPAPSRLAAVPPPEPERAWFPLLPGRAVASTPFPQGHRHTVRRPAWTHPSRRFLPLWPVATNNKRGRPPCWRSGPDAGCGRRPSEGRWREKRFPLSRLLQPRTRPRPGSGPCVPTPLTCAAWARFSPALRVAAPFPLPLKKKHEKKRAAEHSSLARALRPGPPHPPASRGCAQMPRSPSEEQSRGRQGSSQALGPALPDLERTYFWNFQQHEP